MPDISGTDEGCPQMFLTPRDHVFITRYVISQVQAGNKITAIRNLRDYAAKHMRYSLGLKEAKDWVESVVDNVTWDNADLAYEDAERTREMRAKMRDVVDYLKSHGEYPLATSLENHYPNAHV